MSYIVKRPIRSVQGRLIALRKAHGMQTAMPAGTSFLLPDTAAKLIDALPEYETLVSDKDKLEAIWMGAASQKTEKIEIARMFVTDFFRTMKMTIARSVKLKDGKWAATDIDFYNLDETGGKIPKLLTEGEVLVWADAIKKGEANRLLAKPAAPGMTNPDAAEVEATAAAARPLVVRSGQAQAALADKRLELKKASAEADALLEKVWAFVQIHYQKAGAETQREMLRNWGVLYASVGKPNTFTLMVKDSTGAALQGAAVVLLETDSRATANPEGRANLPTRTVGNVTLRISHPGKDDVDLPATIPDDVQGTTIDLGAVVME